MALFRRRKKAEETATQGAERPLDKAAQSSPSPMTNMILADIVLRAGGALLRRGVETGILGRKIGAKKAAKVIKGRTLTQSLVGTALARVATRSVPGAIVVGGSLLAKTLYDRRKGKAARAEAQATPDKADAVTKPGTVVK